MVKKWHESPRDPGVLHQCFAITRPCPYAGTQFHCESDDPNAAYEAFFAYATPGVDPTKVPGVKIITPPARATDPRWQAQMRSPKLSKRAVILRQKAAYATKVALFGKTSRARRHGRLSHGSRGITGFAKRAVKNAFRSVLRLPGKAFGYAWRSLGRIPGAQPLVAVGAVGVATNALFSVLMLL